MKGEHTATSSVMGDIHASGWDLLVVSLLALALYGVLHAVRFGLELAPLSMERRESLRRAFPVVGALAAVLFLLFASGFLFDRYPEHFPIAVMVILGVSLTASWFAIRDLVSGIYLKASRVCRAGDYVRVGEVQGRVQRMGLRVLVVETARGEEAILPYSRMTRDAVLRTPASNRGTLHVFELTLPGDLPVSEAKRRIRESALRCHWSVIAREPQITVIDANRFEITVFGFDSDRVRDIEDEVRRAVGAQRRSDD